VITMVLPVSRCAARDLFTLMAGKSNEETADIRSNNLQEIIVSFGAKVTRK
jgi:hypothetical protein